MPEGPASQRAQHVGDDWLGIEPSRASEAMRGRDSCPLAPSGHARRGVPEDLPHGPFRQRRNGGQAGIRTLGNQSPKSMVAKDFWQQVFAVYHLPIFRPSSPSPRGYSNRPQSWQHVGNAPSLEVRCSPQPARGCCAVCQQFSRWREDRLVGTLESSTDFAALAAGRVAAIRPDSLPGSCHHQAPRRRRHSAPAATSEVASIDRAGASCRNAQQFTLARC